MRIEIETDGSHEGTAVRINGQDQPHLLELEFFVSGLRNRKPTLRLTQGSEEAPRKPVFHGNYFGNDFERYDELFPAEGQEAGR